MEIVLTGVHLGTYGAALPQPETLDGLVCRILEIPGLQRLRLSCIEPMAFPPALIDIAAADNRLAPHFHLPLQSGNDRTLKRMVRPYRAVDYQHILDEIREKLPHACLGTDVIVGFPGETDAEFAATLEFIEYSGLSYVHVFSYSDREGTAATRLGPKVDTKVVKERANALIQLSQTLWARYLDLQLGIPLAAVSLIYDPVTPEILHTLTDNYCTVLIQEPGIRPNRALTVVPTERRGSQLWGHLR